MKNIKFSGISWKGNDGYFYVVIQYLKERVGYHQKPNSAVYYHKVGTPQSKDVFIFGGEKQPNDMYLLVTEDQNYLIISAATTTSG